MRHSVFLCALLALAGSSWIDAAAAQQSAPRIKAAILSFDGHTLVLDADAASVKGLPSPRPQGANRSTAAKAPSGKLTVVLMPATLLVAERPSVLEAIRVGDTVAALADQKDGALTARSLTIYPDALRGANEGRFADGDAMRLGGRVTAIGEGGISLHYRGRAEENGVCQGRALPPAVSPQSCAGDARLRLDPAIPVTILVPGTSALLTPGALATVSLLRNTDGGMATPGVIVQLPQSSPQ
jgi:hypothetical protein